MAITDVEGIGINVKIDFDAGDLEQRVRQAISSIQTEIIETEVNIRTDKAEADVKTLQETCANLKAQMDTLADNLNGQLDVLGQTIDGLKNGIKALQDALGSVSDKKVVKGFSKINKTLTQMDKSVDTMKAEVNAAKESTQAEQEATESALAQSEADKKAAAAKGVKTKATKEDTEATKDSSKAEKENAEQSEKSGKAAKDSAAGAKESAQAHKENAEATKQDTEAAKNWAKELQESRGKKTPKNKTEAYNDLKETFNQVKALDAAGTANWSEAGTQAGIAYIDALNKALEMHVDPKKVQNLLLPSMKVPEGTNLIDYASKPQGGIRQMSNYYDTILNTYSQLIRQAQEVFGNNPIPDNIIEQMNKIVEAQANAANLRVQHPNFDEGSSTFSEADKQVRNLIAAYQDTLKAASETGEAVGQVGAKAVSTAQEGTEANNQLQGSVNKTALAYENLEDTINRIKNASIRGVLDTDYTAETKPEARSQIRQYMDAYNNQISQVGVSDFSVAGAKAGYAYVEAIMEAITGNLKMSKSDLDGLLPQWVEIPKGMNIQKYINTADNGLTTALSKYVEIFDDYDRLTQQVQAQLGDTKISHDVDQQIQKVVELQAMQRAASAGQAVDFKTEDLDQAYRELQQSVNAVTQGFEKATGSAQEAGQAGAESGKQITAGQKEAKAATEETTAAIKEEASTIEQLEIHNPAQELLDQDWTAKGKQNATDNLRAAFEQYKDVFNGQGYDWGTSEAGAAAGYAYAKAYIEAVDKEISSKKLAAYSIEGFTPKNGLNAEEAIKPDTDLMEMLDNAQRVLERYSELYKEFGQLAGGGVLPEEVTSQFEAIVQAEEQLASLQDMGRPESEITPVVQQIDTLKQSLRDLIQPQEEIAAEADNINKIGESAEHAAEQTEGAAQGVKTLQEGEAAISTSAIDNLVEKLDTTSTKLGELVDQMTILNGKFEEIDIGPVNNAAQAMEGLTEVNQQVTVSAEGTAAEYKEVAAAANEAAAAEKQAGSLAQETLNKDYTVSGKKNATDNLRNAYNRMQNVRNQADEDGFINNVFWSRTEEGAAAGYELGQAYVQGIKNGIADSSLETYFDKDWAREFVKYGPDVQDFTKYTLRNLKENPDLLSDQNNGLQVQIDGYKAILEDYVKVRDEVLQQLNGNSLSEELQADIAMVVEARSDLRETQSRLAASQANGDIESIEWDTSLLEGAQTSLARAQQFLQNDLKFEKDMAEFASSTSKESIDLISDEKVQEDVQQIEAVKTELQDIESKSHGLDIQILSSEKVQESAEQLQELKEGIQDVQSEGQELGINIMSDQQVQDLQTVINCYQQLEQIIPEYYSLQARYVSDADSMTDAEYESLVRLQQAWADNILTINKLSQGYTQEAEAQQHCINVGRDEYSVQEQVNYRRKEKLALEEEAIQKAEEQAKADEEAAEQAKKAAEEVRQAAEEKAAAEKAASAAAAEARKKEAEEKAAAAEKERQAEEKLLQDRRNAIATLTGTEPDYRNLQNQQGTRLLNANEQIDLTNLEKTRQEAWDIINATQELGAQTAQEELAYVDACNKLTDASREVVQQEILQNEQSRFSAEYAQEQADAEKKLADEQERRAQAEKDAAEANAHAAEVTRDLTSAEQERFAYENERVDIQKSQEAAAAKEKEAEAEALLAKMTEERNKAFQTLIDTEVKTRNLEAKQEANIVLPENQQRTLDEYIAQRKAANQVLEETSEVADRTTAKEQEYNNVLDVLNTSHEHYVEQQNKKAQADSWAAQNAEMLAAANKAEADSIKRVIAALKDQDKIEKQHQQIQRKQQKNPEYELSEQEALLEGRYADNQAIIDANTYSTEALTKAQEHHAQVIAKVTAQLNDMDTKQQAMDEAKQASEVTELGAAYQTLSEKGLEWLKIERKQIEGKDLTATQKVALEEMIPALQAARDRIEEYTRSTAEHKEMTEADKAAADEWASVQSHIDAVLEATNEAVAKANGELKGYGTSLEEAQNIIKQLYATGTNGKALTWNGDFNAKGMAQFGNEVKNVEYNIREVSKGVYEVREAVKSTAAATSNWDKLTANLGKKFSNLVGYLASFASVYRIFGMIKEGVSTVNELNTQLTEMRKVSDETTASLKRYQEQTFAVAKEVGSTAASIQASTADYLRLGKTLEESAELAKNTSILMSVSEFSDINEATEAMISMTQAFKEMSSMEIIDELNKIGNNFSISTSDLAMGMQTAASTLTVAGNSFEQSLALMTAGNAVIQDYSKTATGLRTISLRIMGTKAAMEELEDMGEDVSDYEVTTTAKMAETIEALTQVNGKKGVNILTDNGNLRSTYDILLDIAKVWDQIREEDERTGQNRQQALLEQLAGEILPECIEMCA